MKPYGIIRPQQQMHQVYEVKIEQKINPQVIVEMLQINKPNIVKNEIFGKERGEVVHVVDKGYLPRRALSLERNQDRRYERRMIFDHNNEQSWKKRSRFMMGGGDGNMEERVDERSGQGSRQGQGQGEVQGRQQNESRVFNKQQQDKIVESRVIKQCFLNCGDVSRDEQQLLIVDEDKDKFRRKPIFDNNYENYHESSNVHVRDSLGEREDMIRSKSKYSSCDSKVIRDRQRLVNKKAIFSKQNKILYDVIIGNEKKDDKRQTQVNLSYQNHLNEVFIKNGEIWDQNKDRKDMRDLGDDRTAKKKTSFPVRVETDVNGGVSLGQSSFSKKGDESKIYESKLRDQGSFYERSDQRQSLKSSGKSIEQSKSIIGTSQNNQGGRPFKKIIGLKSAKCKKDNKKSENMSEESNKGQKNYVNRKTELEMGKESDNAETPKIHRLKPSESRQSSGSSQRSNTSGVSIEIFQIANLDAFTF